MASRTSVYTNALTLPKWVMQGEFGDLSSIMNGRDMDYEKVQQQEMLNDQNEITLENQRRKDRTREGLSTRLGGKTPTSVREAYEQMIEAAYESGDPISAMEYQAKADEYDQSQIERRRKDFANAINIADNAGYDRIEELYPGVLTKDDYNRNQKRVKEAGLKSGDMVVVMNAETGAKDRIPWSMAGKAQELGWEVEPSASRQQDILDRIEQKREELANPPQPGFFSKLFNPTVAEPAPVPRPSPTPAPQDGRGDRARQGPTVGDQVKVIKRERNVKGK